MSEKRYESTKKIKLIDLTPEDQSNITRGIIAIILANGKVTTAEIKYLKNQCSLYIKPDAHITDKGLKEFLENKEKSNITKLNTTSPEIVHFILKGFVKAIYSDMEKNQSETDAYFEVGKQMGISFYILSEMLQIETAQFLIDDRVRGIMESLDKFLHQK